MMLHKAIEISFNNLSLIRISFTLHNIMLQLVDLHFKLELANKILSNLLKENY
jgi:hypothetical protein